MSTPMKTDDPAYFMLDNPNIPRTPVTVYRPGCYICDDDEFARMGLPLCFPCEVCGGHVAADGTVCDDCGYDSYPYGEFDSSQVDEVGLSETLSAVLDALGIDDEILVQEVREQLIETGGFNV
jgi:hypothetical protein